MRFGKALTLLGAVVLTAGSLLLWGCGDDDTSPTNYGSLSDPEFQAVDAQFEQLIDSTLASFAAGLGTISALPNDEDDLPVQYGPGGPGATTDSLSLAYTNGWHILHMTFHNGLGYLGRFTDSVRFMINGDPIEEPANLDALSFRHHWAVEAPDTTVSHFNADGATSIDFEGLDSQEATINGSTLVGAQVKFVSVDSIVTHSYASEATATDFVVSKTGSGWAQGCPKSGQLDATITMTYQKDDGTPIESTWQFSATFAYGTMTATATSDGKTWSYSRPECFAPSN